MTHKPVRPRTETSPSRPSARLLEGHFDPPPRNPSPRPPLSEKAREPGLFSAEIPCAPGLRSDAEAGVAFRASAVLPAAEEALPNTPRLVDSASGYIDTLLMTVPSELHAGNEPHFEALFASLGPETTYVVLHNDWNLEKVSEWQATYSVSDARWRSIVTPFVLEIWAQDPYVAMQVARESGDEMSLLGEGVQFRETGMVVADEVVAGLAELGGPQVRALQSFLFFEGGNILASRSRVLIGKDHLARNLGRPGLPDEDRVSERFERLFGAGRDALLPVGTKETLKPSHRWGDSLTGQFQPIFHLDMHVTPTGVMGRSGREILLYGTPSEAARVVELPSGFQLQPAFDELEELLSRRFEVHRLPLLPVFGNAGVPNWAPQHYYLTWNNVLIESYENNQGGVSRNVFTPVYGPGTGARGAAAEARHVLEEAAAETWADLGFEVRRLSNMEDLAYAGGAAHCITKVLRRGPTPQGRREKKRENDLAGQVQEPGAELLPEP